MLISCPECTLQISDKAISCPHCGLPLTTYRTLTRRASISRTSHRKKLPNGFGQIAKINNSRLRKPFRAMVTVGMNDKGRPVCKLLKPVSYFSTYNEAYEALVEYNKKRKDVNYGKSLKSVYEEWYKEISNDGRSHSYLKAIAAAWSYCEPLYNMPIADLRAKDIKACVINADTSSSFKIRIRSTLSMVFDYAVEFEYTDKNYVKMFKMPKVISEEGNQVSTPHSSFTTEEMETLWRNAETNPYIKMILIQCYSGWRPGELVDLRISNVDLENWTFKGGMKTKAGKGRIVPIHSKVRDYVKFFYDRAISLNSVFLFTTFELNTKCGYAQYYKMFDRIKEDLNLSSNHRPHDPRKFFVTEAKRKNVDEYAIKRLVGHLIEDITENVYTERDIEWLRSEIEKI